MYVAVHRKITRLGLALERGNAEVQEGPIKVTARGVENDVAEGERATSRQPSPPEQKDVSGIDYNGVEMQWPIGSKDDDATAAIAMSAVETVLEVEANDYGSITPVEDLIHGLLLLYRTREAHGVRPEEVHELVEEFDDCFQDTILIARRMKRQYPELLEAV